MMSCRQLPRHAKIKSIQIAPIHAQDPLSDKEEQQRREEEEERPIGPDLGQFMTQQRDEWDKQEEINKEREPLHYQDILFDGE